MWVKTAFNSVLVFLLLLQFASATIYVAQLSGGDGVPGIVRPSDNVVLNSSSTLPASADFIGNGSYSQMNCGTQNPIHCVSTKQMSNMSGRIRAWVKESSSNEVKMVEAYVDNLAPTINSATASSSIKEAVIDYSITDRANTQFSGMCAGIKKIEMFLNGRSVNTTSHPAGNCVVSGKVRGRLASFTGTATIAIVVTDYTDKTANMSLGTVQLDSRPTTFTAKVDLYKPDTETKITRLSPNGTKFVPADIVAAVQFSNALPIHRIVANLGELGATSAEGTCLGFNTSFNCTFPTVNIKPRNQNPKVNLTIFDTGGNSFSYVASLSVTMISSAGTVTRLGPPAERCISNTCHIKAGSNLIVAQISTTSTFNDSDVKINGAQAECYQSGTWYCNATATISGSSLTLEGFDDLGNPISGKTSLILSVDSIAPVRTGNITVSPECPTKTESMIISMNITDSSPQVTIFANTSRISENDLAQAKCTKSGSLYLCKLPISNIKDESTNTALPVIVEDLAGNRLTTSVPISLCIKSDEIPDFLTLKVLKPIPKIDKKVASKIEVKAPVSLEIVPDDQSTKVLEMSKPVCEGTAAYLVNEKSLSPVLIAPLKYSKEWDEKDILTIKCKIDFKVKRLNTIYTKPESESFNIEFALFNQPLGTIDDAYKEKVTGIKEDLRDLDKRIDRLGKVHKYLGGFCKLAETLGKINQVLQTVKSVIWGISVALNNFFGVGEGLWNAVAPALNSFQVFVDSNIWPQGWVPTGGGFSVTGGKVMGNKIGLVIKGTCAVYTCKMYDFNTFVDIGIEVAAEKMSKRDDLMTEVKGSRQEFSDGYSVTYEGSNGQQIIEYKFKDGRSLVEFHNFIYNGQTYSNVAYDGNGNLLRYSHTDGSGQRQWRPLDVKDIEYQPMMAILNLKSVNPPGPDSSNKKHVTSGMPGMPTATSSQNKVTAQTTSSTNMKQRLDKAKTSILSKINPFSKSSTPSVPLDASNFQSDVWLQTAADAFLGENENWIYNPYKSARFDALCMPARLFNAQKERQLLCKRLGCIEQMAKTGGPLEACEYDYNLGTCMYVDSARYKLEGGFGFTSLMKGVKQSFMSNILGTGVVSAYLFVFPRCIDFQSNDYAKINSICAGTASGYRCVACGIAGSLFSGRELVSIIKNRYNPLQSTSTPTALPAGSTDYCAGVNYAN